LLILIEDGALSSFTEEWIDSFTAFISSVLSTLCQILFGRDSVD